MFVLGRPVVDRPRDAPGGRVAVHENLEIVFLGTGASWPSVDRNVASVAVKRGSEILLLDCGEGTQRQLQKSRLSYMQVGKIFVSHLHADHFLGIPGLVQTMRLNERREPLEIYGPPGTREVVDTLLSIGRSRGQFKIVVREVRSGETLAFDGYSVVARELKHTAYNLGWAIVEDDRPGRFNKPRALELGVPEGKLFGRLQRGEAVDTPSGARVTPEMVLGPARRGRKVVYTGDCVPCEGTVELARGADVLVHEATYASDFADANAYGHSTAAQAAFMARSAGVSRLYLTHISPRYVDATPLVEEARKVFAESYEARDFTEFVVKFPLDAEEPAKA